MALFLSGRLAPHLPFFFQSQDNSTAAELSATSERQTAKDVNQTVTGEVAPGNVQGAVLDRPVYCCVPQLIETHLIMCFLHYLRAFHTPAGGSGEQAPTLFSSLKEKCQDRLSKEAPLAWSHFTER